MAIILGMVAFFGLALANGCQRCGDEVPSELRREGQTPYVSCLAGEPPPPRQWRLGGLSLETEKRVLTIRGLRFPIRIAAYSGPEFARDSPEPAFAQMTRARPHLGLMIGGVGDEFETAARTLGLAGGMDFPTLVLAGGRDSWKHLQAAFAGLDPKARDRVIDVSPFREIRIGGEVLIPVAGAAEGRYSLHDDACGFGEDDLEAFADEVGSRKRGRRWLVSWMVPGQGGALAVGRTQAGLDVGDANLALFAERVGVEGGVFSWPRVQVMRPRTAGGDEAVPFGVARKDLRVVVPRMAGPALERHDGTRISSGFALLRLTEDGLLAEPPSNAEVGTAAARR